MIAIKKYILVLLGLIAFTSIHSQFKVAEQDSLALVAFYWATDGPNWISNQEGFNRENLSTEWQDFYDGGFNKWFDGPISEWFGVRVEERALPNSTETIGRVTWLWPVIGRRTDGQNNLSGYVPHDVGLLTALQQFRVNGNDGFRDEIIPDELYLKSLQHFDTEAAWFGKGISDAFRNCTDIRKINVRYNNYDYVPNLDFLGAEGARNLQGTQWFYNSRFSYFLMERIVEFFYSVSPNPMEFGLEARDMFDVGDVQEIVAPLGSSVEMICTEAGTKEEFITYQWFKEGLSRFGRDDKTYSISSVKESDYGHYTTRITNDYVKSYDSNGNYGEVFTKGVFLVPEPVAPVIQKAVVHDSGQYIDLYFSKRMAGSEGYEGLIVQADGQVHEVSGFEIRGRIDREVRIFLSEAIAEEERVILSYEGSVIADQNGGKLNALDEMEVENRAGQSPQLLSAVTTLDGSGIILNFDYFIDANSIQDASFVVQGNNTYEVINKTLLAGPLDNYISKSVLLTLNESLSDSTEILSVQYQEGSIHGLYSGTVIPGETIDVENVVTVDRSEVTLYFEDGSESFTDMVIEGSWRIVPIQLYDDGSNGDQVAGDHTWTVTTALADDEYDWDVFSRTTIAVTDTVYSTDSLGNTVLTLMPREENMDSLITGNVFLSFRVADRQVTGDTLFGILNRDVTFNVQANTDGDNLYLMGIDNDWNDGYLMEKMGDQLYTFTLPKKTAGDVITYNYRKGEEFENQTPETRNYTVVNDENIINDVFGIFTHIEDLDAIDIKIYPNPSNGDLINIESEYTIDRIEIYNHLGQRVKSMNTNGEKQTTIQLSEWNSGIYHLVVESKIQSSRKTFKILIY
ncbi:T9SS type A sorting domain-containing protein [Portibacter marinus]|uniref:T9SS type A sorting domain-containing protein n=1 Tax=Portibacter marinus TaxID=2898660 RepID=UPI001F2B52F0|nr:T9SS type A sorting domain-containing protein [Portibacter marinus]